MNTQELATIADSICARIFDVSVKDIRTGPRTPKICDARHTAWWLLREKGKTYESIGKEYGTHHTTVLSGILRLHNVRFMEEQLMHSTATCYNQFMEATQ